MIVVGCGLTGAVIARCLAEKGFRVIILEKRDHVAGNMYDYIDNYGFLVQKYGPHVFHTQKKNIYDFICKYEIWNSYKLTCGAIWNNKYTPVPFNFMTIDTFFPPQKAYILKKKLKVIYKNRERVTIFDILNIKDSDIREYAEYLLENDYAPYAIKQWGVSFKKIDPSVLRRVPLRLSYDVGYFDDPYQVLPVHSYVHFFKNLIGHPNIHIKLREDALKYLSIDTDKVYLLGKEFTKLVIYTGPIDEFFEYKYGKLPYRSLKFIWKYTDKESFQCAPIVAYPQEKRFTRITEYKKLPNQNKYGSSYAIECPLAYCKNNGIEPYYPVLTEDSQKQYKKYKQLANRIKNLICCGRLGDFKYYNMDQALERALDICNRIERKGGPMNCGD